ncbi:hypothetical protein ZHAS_00005640 [Anopheles sinensis]|uniref:Uncharacterized protein n=1 Tax=Anopheles sinensis TaxID=74873 RepID=A0A084VK01_ANOSI|nr:hypothetical protein ZHAS_00005640 [Anopheles sinensis]
MCQRDDVSMSERPCFLAGYVCGANILISPRTESGRSCNYCYTVPTRNGEPKMNRSGPPLGADPGYRDAGQDAGSRTDSRHRRRCTEMERYCGGSLQESNQCNACVNEVYHFCPADMFSIVHRVKQVE